MTALRAPTIILPLAPTKFTDLPGYLNRINAQLSQEINTKLSRDKSEPYFLLHDANGKKWKLSVTTSGEIEVTAF